MSTDLIDDELAAVQELCRVSWSENEIISRIEQIRQMRKQEAGHLVALHAEAEKLVCVKPNERWG